MRDRPLLVIAALIVVGTLFVVRVNSGSEVDAPETDNLIQTASLSMDKFGIDVSGKSIPGDQVTAMDNKTE